MIFPNRTVSPVDSIISISSCIIEILLKSDCDLNNLYKKHVDIYPKKVPLEDFLISLTFLYTINKIEQSNEVITLKLNK